MLGPVALTPAGPGDIVLAPGLLSSPPTSSSEGRALKLFIMQACFATFNFIYIMYLAVNFNVSQIWTPASNFLDKFKT